MFDSELSQEEDAALQAVLQDILHNPGQDGRFSVDALIEQWAQFVGEVGEGYKLSIYNYCNDLSVRDVLEKVIMRSPEPIGTHIREEVGIRDSVFISSTIAVQNSIAPGLDQSAGSWWFRIPRKLSTELREDLISIGVITSA